MPDLGDAVKRKRRSFFVALLAALVGVCFLTVGRAGAAKHAQTGTRTWVTVRNDRFNTAGLPSGWTTYGPYPVSNAPGYYLPSHVKVPGDGYMHIILSYAPSIGRWAMGAARLPAAQIGGGQNFRITTRFKVVPSNVGSGNTRVAAHRNMPLMWADQPSCAPQSGEMDLNETDGNNLYTNTFLHYCSSSGGNASVSHSYRVNVTKWHVWRYQKVGYTYKVWIDNMTRPVWTYKGTSQTLPPTNRSMIFQQGCLLNFYNGTFHQTCPSGTKGKEAWLIDYVKVAVP